MGKKPLVNEYYDEIIFHEPSQFFHQLLINAKPVTNGVYKHDTDCKSKILIIQFSIFYKNFLIVKEKEKQIIENIQSAKTRIRNEIRELKDRLKMAQENMQLLKEKVETEEMTVEDSA